VYEIFSSSLGAQFVKRFDIFTFSYITEGS